MRTLAALLLALLFLAAPVAEAQQASTLLSVADVTVSTVSILLRAARADRVSIVCTNQSTAQAVRIGPTGVTSTTGVYLIPRGSITLTGTYAIYAIRDTGATADATVSCTEETW